MIKSELVEELSKIIYIKDVKGRITELKKLFKNNRKFSERYFDDFSENKDENILNEEPIVRNIKIFLASSKEMIEERENFRKFLAEENDRLLGKGIYLRLIVWEDFLDAMSQTRLQDEYNKAIQECDVFVMLYFTKVGKYTEEEFAKAFKNFTETNRPRIYTYFKMGDIKSTSLIKEDVISLFNFKDKLKELGHFQTLFEHHSDLHLHFKRQLEKLYNL